MSQAGSSSVEIYRSQSNLLCQRFRRRHLDKADTHYFEQSVMPKEILVHLSQSQRGEGKATVVRL